MLTFRSLVIAAVVAGWLNGPLQAAESAAATLTVKSASVGFGGKFKPGFWQPVRLTVVAGPQGAKGRLELVALDGDQAPVIYRDTERGTIDLAAGEEQSVLLYGKSGPIDGPFTVQLVAGDAVAWSQQLIGAAPTLRSTQELVVSLGPPIGIEEAAATIRRRGDAALQAAGVRDAAELPDRWWGYDGVDVLVLTTRDEAFLSAMTEEQRQAIIEWVQFGGRVVLSVGKRGEEIAAAQSNWAALVPGTFAEADYIRERIGLENFTKAELPFEDPQFQRNRPEVTRLKDVRGEVLLDEGGSSVGRELAIHAAAGLGQVTFVGLDLDHPSLKSWKGRAKLIAALLQRGAAEREQSDFQIRHGVAHLGYEDLVGQLRAALDQFSGVSLVNFTTVSVLTLVYLLLVGPIDYLFLSRLSISRHWTWLTFPHIAAVTIVVAILIGGQVHGHRVRVNQAEIVDVDLTQQLARGTMWCHVYSPATKRYDVSLSVSMLPGETTGQSGSWLAWQGLPGDSLGGLESRQPVLVPREPYIVSSSGNDRRIDDITVQVASSKSLSACWWSTIDLPAGSKLTVDRYGLLAGEFHQPLPMALTDCILAHGEKLYRLGNLQPQDLVRMADLPPLNLEARLTQRRVEQSKDVSTPWEQDSVDIPRIMQMLMFHEAARGRNYTGLTHRYQPKIDLSEHVRLGQAVLVGRAASVAGTLRVPPAFNGTSTRDAGARVPTTDAPLAESADTNTWTWYRVILPVTHN